MAYAVQHAELGKTLGMFSVVRQQLGCGVAVNAGVGRQKHVLV